MHKILQTIKWQLQWHVITKNVIRNNIVLCCLYDRSWSNFVGVLCYVVLMKIPKPDKQHSSCFVSYSVTNIKVLSEFY